MSRATCVAVIAGLDPAVHLLHEALTTVIDTRVTTAARDDLNSRRAYNHFFHVKNT